MEVQCEVQRELAANGVQVCANGCRWWRGNVTC